MEKELLNKGELKIEIKDGKLVVMLDTKGVDVSAAFEADYFLDKLAEAIPGQIDDTIIAIIKGALKG